MKDVYILGIESSCDETSMSIVKNGSEEIATIVLSQIDIHKNYGGVVPEIASRNHIENITIVLEELLSKANMKLEDITAIGVTYGPGLIGSLLIGVQAAKTISLVTGKPLIPVHHIIGHIYANNLKERLTFPLIALVVSGGHTELIYMKEDYSFTKIGGTLDDAVGECYDKVAKVLGLEYPGGPKVDKLAHLGKDTYNLPYPLDDSTYNFSFSGIKSAVINLVHNEEQRGNTINKGETKRPGMCAKEPMAPDGIVRLSKIEVYPQYLDEYVKHAAEVGEVSLRTEPGVLTMYAVQEREAPCRITILETYASRAAYDRHIDSEHFRKYKQETLHMIESLELSDQLPLNPANRINNFMQ